MKDQSTLQEKRLKYQPHLPEVLRGISGVIAKKKKEKDFHPSAKIKELFPNTIGQSFVEFTKEKHEKIHQSLRVGVVFSGGQAAGGHNVIAGLFDALKELNRDSTLIGFLGGPSGIIDGKSKEITADLINEYRNQGGFDMIGSGRTKIETEEQLQKAYQISQTLKLDGLIVIGGDDSNTNAAVLAEYFSHKKLATRVVGVPKTIDGDLKTEHIEISFGFDSACKVYSELIGNIAKDALSAKKYYHFIRLMGRSASHITLECALATHVNMALISEEVFQKNMTLYEIAQEIAEIICQRSALKKDYGVILIPEGLIEFIPEIKNLIKELNSLLAENTKNVEEKLSKESRACFKLFPEKIQSQLLLDRDPHGNVQVSKIETEKLLVEIVAKELEKRSKEGTYKGKFNAVEHFFGYEGRSCMPSNFDAQYCYGLGFVATLLVSEGLSGYIACLGNLTQGVDQWQPKGVPLSHMLTIETRKGKDKPVIKKALVELDSKAFIFLQKMKPNWQVEDHYRNPGPIQFFGEKEVTDTYPLSMTF